MYVDAIRTVRSALSGPYEELRRMLGTMQDYDSTAVTLPAWPHFSSVCKLPGLASFISFAMPLLLFIIITTTSLLCYAYILNIQ